MKKQISIFAILTMCLMLSVSVFGQYKTATPMSLRISSSASLQPVKSGSHPLPVIAWGGDIATIYGDMTGIFKNEGANISTLFREDVLTKQVEKCLSGETPYLRGTLGMINAAADAFRAKGMELVVFYGMTWSTNGDGVAFRAGKNLKNAKNVILQLDGPHMDYAANMFTNAGRLEQIKFNWVTDLLAGVGFNGPDQFVKDPIAGEVLFAITPDLLTLTSNGTVGTGSEGSVKGATLAFTTKTNSRIIFDVYAVRKDYFDTHKDEVFAFASALMKSQEALQDLMKNKSSRQSEFKQLMTKAADLILDDPTATATAEAMLGDCTFIGFDGNYQFFTGKGATRNFKTLNSEIQSAFQKMNLLDEPINVLQANWDYAELKQGLKYATIDVTSAAPIVATVTPKFDANKVAKMVESKIAAESDTWEEEGTLYTFEIYFEPNQEVFDITKYSADFKEILRLAQTNAGAIVVLEGYSDPGAYLKAQKAGSSTQELAQIKQAAKNLSAQRSTNAKKAFVSYCKQKGISFDESQLTSVGRGIDSPKYVAPKTKEQWLENFRVIFRLKQIEAENLDFDPNIYK